MRDDFVVEFFDAKFILDLVTRRRIPHGIRKIVVNGRMPLQKLPGRFRHLEPRRPTSLRVLEEIPRILLLQPVSGKPEYFGSRRN